MIVEDERTVAELLATTLKELGYEIASVVSAGEDAVRMAEAVRPEVILMDIALDNVMDEMGVAAQLHSLLQVPVIYITANPETSLLARTKMTNSWGYPVRPILPEELGETIEVALCQKEMEQRLAESESRYRAIVQDQTELICRYAPEGTFTFANDAYCRYFANKPEELIGQQFALPVFEEDREALEKHFEALSPDNPVRSHELRVINQDGEIRWLHWNARAIFDDQGRLLEFQGVGRDVTDRKKIHDDALASQASFSSIVDTSREPIMVLRKDGDIAYANRSAAAFLKQPQGELLGTQFGYPLVPGQAAELEVVLTNGQVGIVEMRVEPTDWHGEDAWLVKLRDITDGKRAEEQAEYRRQILEVVNRILQETLASPDEEDVVNVGLFVAMEVTESRFGWIGEISEKGRLDTIAQSDLNWRACRGPRESAPKLMKDMEIRGIWSSVLKTERSQIINDPASHPDSVAIPKGHVPINSFLGVPLRRSGKIFGMIALANKEGGYSLRDAEAVETLSIAFVEALHRRRAQDRLEESEERYRSLFDDSIDGVYETSRDGRLIEANRAFLEIFGNARDEMIGMDIRGVYRNPTEHHRFVEDMEKKGFVKDYPLILLKKDGQEIECEVSATAILDKERTLQGYRGIIRDVTERNRARKRLERLNKALRAQSKSNEALLRATSESDLMNSVCKVVVEEAGYRFAWVGLAEQDKEKSVLPVAKFGFEDGYLEKLDISWADTERGRGPAGTAIRTGLPVPVGDFVTDPHYEPWRAEALARGYASGLSLPISFKGEILGALNIYASKPHRFDTYEVSLLTELADNLSYGIGSLRTRKEREMTEERLRASEQRFRLLVESSPIGVSIFQHGKRGYVNPAVVSMSGYETPEEVLALPPLALYADEERERLDNLMGSVERGEKELVHLQTKGLRKAGDIFDVSLWVVPTEFNDLPAVLAFSIDESENKSLRDQLTRVQKMESLGTLAGGIAHDFNNLLTVIQGYAELLLVDKGKEHPEYNDLQVISSASQRGADLVRRILTFSRKVESEKRFIDLNEELAHSRKLLERTLPKMVKIRQRLQRKLGKIYADPGQIEQVLLNLAVNASHAMPEGGELSIRTEIVQLDEEYCATHVEAQPGEHVLLTVSDTGCGMQKAVVDHIFEPFFTTKNPGEGTGLGLSMVFGIVKDHEGHITCYSEPGIGTTFKIYFPIQAEANEFVDLATSGEFSMAGAETILLVDDEEGIRDLGKRILCGAGYTVITAGNGREALEVFRKRNADISIVILDLIMPEMGGKECLEELLKLDPQVKVIVSSGFLPDGMTKEVVDKGSKGFVNKPFRSNDMLRMIRETLDRS